ncbi:MAG: choice-of-anchor L domain-containing protein [Flavobacteriales bacterium]|nr:choice-of-anchor L domain-containing protein [Flavobacteriales bacterium]
MNRIPFRPLARTIAGLLAAAAFLLVSPAFSQVEVNSTLTPEQYVNDVLLGVGVVASNVTYTGSPVQIGHVTGLEDSAFPITEGLLLSTEVANNIAEEDCIVQAMIEDGLEVSGDADLLNIANSVPGLIGQNFNVNSVNDICAIEFDFLATGDTVKFNYVFGSDEYMEWVNSQYNDIFGFFLSGPGITGPYASPAGFPDGAINLAEVPDTDPQLPITISSVNDNLNSEYYIDNVGNDIICQDGYTVVLQAVSEVECGETYHIRLAIGDGSDTALESVVILESGSFESNAVVQVELTIDVGSPGANILYEDCGEAVLTFTRPIETILDVEEMVIISYAGSEADNGIDYTLLPDSVVFPPGVEVVSFPLDAFEDGLVEGSELVIMEILNLAACNGGGVTSYFEFTIWDEPFPLVVNGFETTICVGDSVVMEPDIEGGYGNFHYEWDCEPGYDDSPVVVYPLDDYDCILVVTDTCGMPSDDALFEITVEEYPELTAEIIGGDIVLACNGFADVVAAADGGNPPYTWTWEIQDGQNAWGWENTFFLSTWTGATELHAIVTDDCGFTAEAVVDVSIDVPELIIELDESYPVACNVPFEIVAEAQGGEPFINYTWVDGFNWLDFDQTLNWTTDVDMNVTLQVSDACGQFVEASTLIEVVSEPLEVTLPDTLTGPCTEVFFLNPQVANGSGVYTYIWTQNFVFVSDESTYSYQSEYPTSIQVEIVDNCQAEGSALAYINVVNPPLEISLPDTLFASCVDLTAYTVDIISGSGNYVYEWLVGDSTYSNLPSINVQSYATVPIGVEVEDGCGGEADASSVLVIPDIPMTLAVSADTSICRGGSVFMSAEATGGEGGFVYTWPSIPAFGTEQFVSPSYSSNFPVAVTDICGETIIDGVSVEVQYIYSDFYTSYVTDTKIEFIATPDPDCVDCEFYWNFGDDNFSFERNPTHEYDGLGDYLASLRVTNALGCTDSAYTLVTGPVILYIPTAFTPNNDGINDAFEVVISDVIEYELSIFNRWGNLIFHSFDPAEVWIGDVMGGAESDGAESGANGEHYAPNGIYSYRIKWKGARTDAEEFSGSIELMR